MSSNDVLNGYATGFDSDAQRNRVLRNTYWLLALSLVPTVLGAWLGMATGIGYVFTGWLRLVVFLGGAFAFMWAIQQNRNSGVGVALLLVVLVGRTRTNGLAILLMGIAMESVLSSVAAVLLLYLPGDASVAMAEWMAGSLFQANWASLSILLVLVALSLPALLLAGPSLAVQALGTDMAMALGLEAARIRPALLLLAVLMNTLAVAVVGPLTLLGVIAPQLADFACRSSGSMRLILSGLMGSLLVLMADTVSRGLLADTALPVGLALTLVGVPLFVAAMRLQAWRKGRVS